VRPGDHEAGQSTFELVGYVMIVLLVTVVCVQGVYVSQAAATAQQAARDGARAYTLGQSVETAVASQLPDWIEAEGTPKTTYDPKTRSVKVEVKVNVPVMAGNRQVGTVTMTRSAVMPTERPSFSPGIGAPKGVSGLLDPSTLCALSWAPSKLLRCDAAAALEQLNQAYLAHFGKNISITDAYRDYASQVLVYMTKPNLAARPGTSNHGWGLAVDLGGGVNSFGTSEYNWMKQNAPAYGWNHPAWAEPGSSRPEPWHWEFGG
jgi:hypothetical protein